MLRPSDQEYQATKLIKLSKATLDAKNSSFAEWIDKTYQTKILNVYVDLLNPNCTRVQLIFDLKITAEQFFNKDRSTLSYYKKNKIIKKFVELNPESNSSILLLVYAFEPLAKEEANTKIPLKSIAKFKEKYQDLIWEISRFGEYTTFFLHTELQLKVSKTSGLLDQIRHEYFEILKKYDQLNYFNTENFHAIFDSKENFDHNYNSNWRAYYN